MNKDSNLIVQIAADGTLSISTNTALDKIYQEIFTVACQSAATDPNNIEHGTKAIIFGCFWLEAYTNELVRVILNQETKNQKLAAVLWDSLKKANFQEKFKMVSVFADDKTLGQFNTVNSRLKAAFDLRNRLAHYKDDDQFIAKDIYPDDFDKVLENLPDSDLVKQLVLPKLEDCISAIRDGGKWLSAIGEKYIQAEE